MKQTRLPIILMILAVALTLLTVSITLAREGAGSTNLDTLKPAAAFPVCTGFESGSLPAFFTVQTIPSRPASGRVTVTTAFPHSGLYALDLDTDCDGCGSNTTQAAIMSVDLAGQSNVYLNFWVHEHGDENHPEDGVFISDDGGATWALILSLNNYLNSYQEVNIDLVTAAAGAGMSLVNGFLVKFQSFDNFSIPIDGYSFDDICVEPRIPGIVLTKTVGIDPAVCATTDEIEISSMTDVIYCYRVTNTGNVILDLHDLVDNVVGKIYSGFAYTFQPGNSIFLTKTATINATTVNTATWTAYNPGPVDQVSFSDTATVTFVYYVYLPAVLKEP